MSEMCVQATARTALARGYRVVLPHDAHGTYNVPAVPGVSEEILPTSSPGSPPGPSATDPKTPSTSGVTFTS
jgi:hypothetical protein